MTKPTAPPKKTFIVKWRPKTTIAGLDDKFAYVNPHDLRTRGHGGMSSYWKKKFSESFSPCFHLLRFAVSTKPK
jgi:hypothetical protein